LSQHLPRPKNLWRLDPLIVWPPSRQPDRQYALMRPGEWSEDLQAAYNAGYFLVETDNPESTGPPLAIYGIGARFAEVYYGPSA
jgi:hypothetical protein